MPLSWTNFRRGTAPVGVMHPLQSAHAVLPTRCPCARAGSKCPCARTGSEQVEVERHLFRTSLIRIRCSTDTLATSASRIFLSRDGRQRWHLRLSSQNCLFAVADWRKHRQHQPPGSFVVRPQVRHLSLCASLSLSLPLCLPLSAAHPHSLSRKADTVHRNRTKASESASGRAPQAGERTAHEAAHTEQKDGSGASPWRELREATPAQQRSPISAGSPEPSVPM